MRLDLEYIDNWSLWLDFKILLRTDPGGVAGHGGEVRHGTLPSAAIVDRRFAKCQHDQTSRTQRRQPVSVVTGAAGFLGSHLTDLLLARGHKVIGIDNFITGSVDNIAHLGGNRNFKFIQQDVTEFLFPRRPGGLRLALRLARQPD